MTNLFSNLKSEYHDDRNGIKAADINTYDIVLHGQGEGQHHIMPSPAPW